MRAARPRRDDDAMRTAVTGSVAIDHLATFPGSFGEQLIDGALDRISLSFLVNRLDVRYGGVAANITAGLGRLGQRPLLVAAAGHDFGEYRAWLEAAGVDTAGVLVDEEAHTARFWCTTDREQNQIASFHPGAMTSARRIELEHVLARAGRVDLVVIGPDDAEAMLRHTECCRGLDLAFAADPSQQLALLDGPAIRRLVDGARYLFTNEYEHALLLRKTGWGEADVRRRVGVWITTLGAAGVRIDVAGRDCHRGARRGRRGARPHRRRRRLPRWVPRRTRLGPALHRRRPARLRGRHHRAGNAGHRGLRAGRRGTAGAVVPHLRPASDRGTGAAAGRRAGRGPFGAHSSRTSSFASNRSLTDTMPSEIAFFTALMRDSAPSFV